MEAVAWATGATREYDAWGAPLATSGTPQGPFGFAGGHGYQEDGDSGLKLLGHRYYDPSVGRFLTRDHAKDGRNWYGYCANNPGRFVDPTGNIFLVDDALIITAIAAIAIVAIAVEAAPRVGQAMDSLIRDINNSGPITSTSSAPEPSPEPGGVPVPLPTRRPPRDYYRFGTGDDKERMQGEVTAAANNPDFGPGLSVSSKPPKPGTPYRVQSAAVVESVFKVYKTGNSPFHYTVRVGDPVSDSAVDQWNKLFPPIK